MKKIEFTLPEFGNTVGTTKWVATKLEEISKTFKNSTTKGSPCLTYDELKKDGSLGTYIFCIAGFDPYSCEGFNCSDRRISKIYPTDNTYYCQNGLFTYLTPKAKEIVEEFIDRVSEEWIEELEKN